MVSNERLHKELQSNETKGQVFIGHEYTRAAIDDLREAIKRAFKRLRIYTTWYTDDELWNGQIFADKIIPQIKNSVFGIYDISNPEAANVFLELGAAVAVGRPYVIICKTGTEIPSNLDGLDSTHYQSFKHLEDELVKKIKRDWPNKMWP